MFAEVPFGLPEEPLAGADALGFRVPLYGLDQWRKLFTPRQLLALGVFVRAVRAVPRELTFADETWREAVGAYLATAISKIADRGSTVCSWTVGWDKVRNTFARFALPMTWDFAEAVAGEDTSGGFPGAVEWAARYIEHALAAAQGRAQARNASAIEAPPGTFDVIVTDPPYYDAIPYSDLMDFFYVWLRRTLHGLSPAFDAAFAAPLAPKWDKEKNDGERRDQRRGRSGIRGRG